MSEYQLQCAAAEYLDLKKYLWFHVANERKTTPRAGYRLTLAGVKSGVPDILIFHDWRIHVIDDSLANDTYRHGYGIAIELKIGRNKPTATQRAWLDALEHKGWYTAVCRSLNEVIEICHMIV